MGFKTCIAGATRTAEGGRPHIIKPQKQKGQPGAPETVPQTLPVRRASWWLHCTGEMLQSDCGMMNIWWIRCWGRCYI